LRYINRDCRTISNLVECYGQRISRLEDIANSEPSCTGINNLARAKSQITNYYEILSYWEGRCTEIERGRVVVDSLDQKLKETVDAVSGNISSEFEKSKSEYKKDRLAKIYTKLVMNFSDAKKSRAIDEYIAGTEENKESEEPELKPNTEKTGVSKKKSRFRGFVKAAAGIAAGFILFTAYSYLDSNKSKKSQITPAEAKINLYLEQIDRNPKDCQSHLELAEFYEKNNMPKKAKKEYKIARMLAGFHVPWEN
jgi:hypothetical protein